MEKLPVVLCVHPHLHSRAMNLVQWCRDLDGTEVDMIVTDEAFDRDFVPMYPDNKKWSLAAQMLLRAAGKYEGRPFIWIEPDAIPIAAGWVKTLSAEYHAAAARGKCFLLPCLYHEEELGCGVGAYGPDARWLLPRHYQKWSWDKFVYESLIPLVEFTHSIQHSYRHYKLGRDHIFPEDDSMLRPGAVLFHADKQQSLIGRARPIGNQTYFHDGDLGDLLAFLAVVRRAGGGNLAIHPDRSQFLRPFTHEKFEWIRPVLEAQPYIGTTNYRAAKPADINMHHWREHLVPGQTLISAQAGHAGVHTPGNEPWIFGFPRRPTGRVVFSRSARYHDPKFPWPEIWKTYRRDSVFVGLPDEHAAFEAEIGPVPYYQCFNAADMAELLASSALWVGNQSMPFWLAAGIGVPTIQETCADHLNSVIRRPSAQYSTDGRVLLPRINAHNTNTP